MMNVGGYHECQSGGCSVHWGDVQYIGGMFSTSGDIMMHVGEQADKSIQFLLKT